MAVLIDGKVTGKLLPLSPEAPRRSSSLSRP